MPEPLRDLYEQWWSSLDRDRRDRLILATSHSANYLLDLIERPSRAFTILREPVDRVLSRYYFFSKRPPWTLRELYADPPQWLGDQPIEHVTVFERGGDPRLPSTTSRGPCSSRTSTSRATTWR